MKLTTSLIPLLSAASLIIPAASTLRAQNVARFLHVPSEEEVVLPEDEPASLIPPLDSALLRVREVHEIISSLGAPDFKPTPVNKTLGPWVFLGYRNLDRKRLDLTMPTYIKGMPVMTNEVIEADTMIMSEPEFDELPGLEEAALAPEEQLAIYEEATKPALDIDILADDITPKWLRDALTSYRIQEDFMYANMMSDPSYIDYSYWDLPVPPRLLEDDITFSGYIKRLHLPDVDLDKAVLPEEDLRKIHWLHTIGSSLQFSQAYVSSNWYQGGNNHLSLLFNFSWNVQLNQVYHPNLLFQSTLAYKLGLNSTPQDEVHSYSISEDLLQYNLNAGVKAFKKWYYSLNALFKTQVLRNYEKNSMTRTASFLSPGDLNVGLGMAYSTQNAKKTFQFTASISPVSYNLKTCITDKIDHSLYNIAQDRKSRSEFGSNAEFNMTWKMSSNISYSTRMFLFSDYKYFLSDWENTFTFNINRFLSTQIYVHLRYDSSADKSTAWKNFMMREVLSFGLTYAWSTKS